MRVPSLFLLSLFVACSGEDASVRQRFLAQSGASVRFENWVRCLNNQDRDSVASFYQHVPELRVLQVDGTITRGWEAERESQKAFFDAIGMVNFVPNDLEIDVLSKDLVLTTFRFALDIEAADGQRDPTLSGVGTMVWIKDPADGEWKIRLQQLSSRMRSDM